MMICLPRVPSLAAMQIIFSFNDQPEIMHVYVPHIGWTHPQA